ncbi:unnamed protein product [Linum trigynum]|uniref:Uncharacterized protein n=1 Tax=Linum trigynum TaxID=586398 RepID=A0AAV2CG08_9ROSI
MAAMTPHRQRSIRRSRHLHCPARAREPRPPPPVLSFGYLDARLDRIESTQKLLLWRLGIPYVPFGHSSGASTSSDGPSDTRSQEDGDYPGSD